jgi:hypothetical protein
MTVLASRLSDGQTLWRTLAGINAETHADAVAGIHADILAGVYATLTTAYTRHSRWRTRDTHAGADADDIAGTIAGTVADILTIPSIVAGIHHEFPAKSHTTLNFSR